MALTKAARERNERRTVRRIFTMTLIARTPVSRNTTRFTFTAAEFADFEALGPDEFFALIIPVPGRDLPPLPAVDEDIREIINTIPEDVRPEVRWYTVRAHRPALAEIDVDIVLHGDSGPASRWATDAEPGDVIGFRESSAPYIAPEGGRQLLVADETALPALAAILEQTPAGLDTVVMAEVPGPEDIPAIATDVEIAWFHRGDADPGSALLPALEAVVTPHLSALSYAWLCGERALATGSRRWLVEAGFDPDQIMFSGYWRLGQARG